MGLQPRQQGFGQRDATVLQQRLALMGLGVIGNRRVGKIDDRIQRLFVEVFQARNFVHLGAADLRDFFCVVTPHRQAMVLLQPVLAELMFDQTSTAGQQYVHDIFLVWHLIWIISLFL